MLIRRRGIFRYHIREDEMKTNQQKKYDQTSPDDPPVMGVIALGALAIWIAVVIRVCAVAIPLIAPHLKA